jgi:hypothetical protein
MTTQKRDVLLTLIGTSSAKQVQLDHYWFECDGPVTKAEITRGVQLYVDHKQAKEGKTMDRDHITIYNVFVAENQS